METEVLQNVTEKMVGNINFTFLQVVIEAVLKVSSHFARQVSDVFICWCLSWVSSLGLLCGFHVFAIAVRRQRSYNKLFLQEKFKL